jgi:hypothetical protein
MYNMFSTDYYQLIFLFTFESANMVAKAKQKIGSKTKSTAFGRVRGEQWLGCCPRDSLD